jgi:vanillate O-demethylase ferredoxin subunit
MTSSVRTRILQVHRWSGLTLGLLMLFLSITGLALVFRAQLEPAVDVAARPLAGCAAPLALDTLIANARAAHSTGALEVVKIHAESEPTMVRFSDDVEVFVHPCSGAVMGQQPRWGGVFGTLEQWHRFRFLDSADVGNFITGGAALVMALLMAIGGIVVWWPRSLRTLKTAATLRPHLKGRAFDLNLHRTAGFYASLVILAVALTSLPLAFKWVRHGINTVVGSPEAPKKPKSSPSADARALSLGTLWERAQPLVGHPSEAVLQVAKKKTDPVEIYVIEEGAPHPNARSYFYFDAYSGATLRAEPYATSSLGNKIYRWSASIHSGEVGGVFAQLLQFLGILAVPVLAYSGIRSWLRRRYAVAADAPALAVRVRAVRAEADDIKSFELVSADATPLPPFTAGSHIDVKVDEGLTRQYSLCNDPAEKNRYVIAVKRAADSRGGSRTLHERIEPGDLLRISAPRNHFPLQPSARHHLLLAAGIGITPLLSMARQLQAAGESFALHYFARSIGQTAFHEELSRPAFCGKVSFHYAVERERQREYLRNVLWHRPQGAHLYICGPRGFMDAVETTAAATWPPEAVHVEYFNADPLAAAGPQQEFEIALQRSRCSLKVPAGTSIATVLARNGIACFTSCEQGVCGSCLTGVLDGEPDHRDAFLSPAERREGKKIMVCVSRAKGRGLVLDL